ncbi:MULTISPECIES: extracellular solute-binding protein [unclassified Leifsonia]|uniref:extracellular solute-binding protein n=1 Tax=unclassified Leifsonia TaxID=2663824 RepID=UPI0008A7ECC0|nr:MULTISPECIES: extracellular solute-binding protein [unclassified Leifsonia]SEI14601.1 raffinose/stachyose/melibiose transport system substrate-binding protein [Leifsonia sp. CL154]SFM02203.1 raffinose/stachyose/melibiose transport system substrate-binding protein [Leifsonia sp. CL147]
MKLTSKRGRAVVAVVIAAALSLTACSTGGSSGSKTASAWALTGGDEQTFRSSFTEWNKANPDQKIDSQFFANDAYKEKIRSAVGSGNAPALIYSWAGGTLADYVKNKNVVDITEQSKDLTSRLIPSVAANGVIGGKTYAVPNNSMQSVVLWYNKGLFKQEGVEPPKTWDDLMKLVDTFNGKGIAPFSMAGASKWPELMWLEYLADRIGGPEAFKAVLDGKKNAWSNPAFKQSLEKIQQLVKANGFIKGYESITADANADIAAFYTGKAAMILQGSWVYPNFKNNAKDFFAAGNVGYVTFPAVSGGKGDPANIVGNPANFWSVSSSSSADAQKSAESYLNKAVLDDTYVDTLLKGGAVPPITGIESKIAKLDDADYLGWVYKRAVDAPSFQLSWDQALPAAQGQALLTNLDQVFLGQMTPQGFVDAMNTTLGS